MVQPSKKWLDKFKQTLVPESFIEITYHASDDKAQEDAIASSGSQTSFSKVSSVTNLEADMSCKYATGEKNFWILDESMLLVPDSEPYEDVGYVSEECVFDLNHPTITFSFSKIHQEKIPGLTIIWSTIFNEFAKSFSVKAYSGSSLISEVSITDNESVECPVDFEISDYDSIVIEVLEWCIPERRARMEQVEFGQRVRFYKSDLLSYTHESKRDPISGQLSKDSISFSINNSEQRWNPVNPDGLYKYLYERQAVFVRYGMDIDGTTEWINGGKFYLSGWSTPSNGITASFEARDALVFLSDSTYTGRTVGTLYEMCHDALELLHVSGITYWISEELKNYSTELPSNSSYKNSDILQLSANAAGMALYQTRDGKIKIERVDFSPKDSEDIYEISELNNYDYPEITFSNKLKNISYSDGNGSSFYPKGATGDGVTQSVSNALLSNSIIGQPKNILTESYKILSNRRKVTLSYRASPHNDAFDFFKLNHQFGYSSNVLVTDVKYTFNGCFKGSVTGYMIEDVGSLNLNTSEIFLSPSDAITLTATLSPATADSPVVIWSSYPSGVVDLSVVRNERGVSVCNVTYLHEGTATITAAVSGLSATCTATTISNVLSNFAEGSIVKLTENGTWYEFVVAKHDYEPGLNKTGNTLLVRKDSIANGIAWNSSKVNTYANSTIDNYLNDNYKNALSSFVKGKLKKTTFYYTPGNKNKELTTLSRNVFLLSAKELVFHDWTEGQMWGKGCNGEGTLLPTAEQLVATDVNDKAEYGSNAMWTRTPVYDARYFGIPSGHNTDSAVGIVLRHYADGSSRFSYVNFIVSGTVGYCYRPAFTVPSNLKIGYENRIEE